MDSLYHALFHWPPGKAETMPRADQSTIFSHETILELRAPIAPDHKWQGARSEDASSKGASYRLMPQIGHRLEEGAMAQAAHVSKCVLTAMFVGWVGRPLAVNHDFFPALAVMWNDSFGILLGRTTPKPQAR